MKNKQHKLENKYLYQKDIFSNTYQMYGNNHNFPISNKYLLHNYVTLVILGRRQTEEITVVETGGKEF